MKLGLFSSPIRSLAALAAGLLACAPLSAQVRKMHTRDYTRLSQLQIDEYLKRSDVIFIPVGAVETNGILPGDRDWVSPLGYAMAMADEMDALFMPGLMWSYPGTTLVGSSTVNITPTMGVAFLKNLAESLYRAGFRRQIYLSSGQGPAPLTVGTMVREFFDEFRVPILYIEMGDMATHLKIPPAERNRTLYGAHHIAGRIIDLPLKGDYGDAAISKEPIPQNEGYNELGKLGVSGSLTLGSWVTDVRAHGGGGSGNLPSTEAEREEWGKQGEAQIRAIVKKMNLPAIVENLKKHDEYTNKVLVPKFQKILPPAK